MTEMGVDTHSENNTNLMSQTWCMLQKGHSINNGNPQRIWNTYARGGHCHWLEYAYARTDRVCFLAIYVPERVWFSNLCMVFLVFVPVRGRSLIIRGRYLTTYQQPPLVIINERPLRVRVSRCHPSRGIHFPGEHPPPPRVSSSCAAVKQFQHGRDDSLIDTS